MSTVIIFLFIGQIIQHFTTEVTRNKLSVNHIHITQINTIKYHKKPTVACSLHTLALINEN